MSEDPVVVVGMARTPIGGLLGELSSVESPKLASTAISSALERAGVDGADIDEAIIGCVLPAGLKQAPARQAVRGAGLPDSAAANTLNKVCGSGMKAMMMAHDSIKVGSADVMIAGGMESMSRAPHILPTGRSGHKYGDFTAHDHMAFDGLTDAYAGEPMGNFAELCAEHYQFTREAQDAYAIESLARANRASEDGSFEGEITPVTIKSRKGEIVIDSDEQPRNARPEKIPSLRPAFKKDGTVTAANASSISDGAAALVMMRQSEAEKRGLTPLAVIRGHATHAQAPEWFTTAPVVAIEKLLTSVGWDKNDVDLFEINEAFAVVPMAVMQEMGISHDKVNVNGGACALGHPIGASGARIVVTLINALHKRGLKKGIAGICIGGGEGTALAVELPN